MIAFISLIFTAARQQSVLINGAIGLQVVVGAITTGVAAGSKNVRSSHPTVSKYRSTDTLIDRSELQLPSLVGSLPL